VSATLPLLASDAVLDVRPGDQNAATEVEGWLQDYAISRDPQLRERIILAYLGLADRLASRYRQSRGVTPEDLAQTARAGLIAAVDRYEPGYGTPFVPYAVACVVGELKRSLRDTSWRLHVPRRLKEQALRLCRAADELHQRLARSPSRSELARHLELDEEKVLEAMAGGYQPPGGVAGPARRRRRASPWRSGGRAWSPRRNQTICWPCPAWCQNCRSWNERSSSCGSFRSWTRTPSRPGSASRRCTSHVSSVGLWPACVLSWWSSDQAKEVAMQVMGM
jgi:RNA polymerase sigma factor (sigma-70 family)